MTRLLKCLIVWSLWAALERRQMALSAKVVFATCFIVLLMFLQKSVGHRVGL